jgi:hypothetical protein
LGSNHATKLMDHEDVSADISRVTYIDNCSSSVDCIKRTRFVTCFLLDDENNDDEANGLENYDSGTPLRSSSVRIPFLMLTYNTIRRSASNLLNKTYKGFLTIVCPPPDSTLNVLFFQRPI